MHILIIPSGHYVTQQMPLGAIFQHQQACALKEKGIKVGVVSAGFMPFKMNYSQYPYASFEDDGGIPTYRHYKRMYIPGSIANKLMWKYLINLHLKIFDKYCHEQGMPEIIHAHNCLFAGVVALKIKEKYGIPFLITEHNSLYARGLFSNQEARHTKEVLRNADAITVVSTKLGSLLGNLFGADACPNYAIFNIVDDRFAREEIILKCAKNNKDVFTFLSIGSLDDNKNHVDLLKAFASKFKANDKIKLRIGGDGPLRQRLEKQVKELGIVGQVVFTGLLSRDEVLCEMRNCDVFVLPSIVETFGVVLIEMLALGKPVVATKCGGPEDIVNQDNGILVPTKDVQALAEDMSYIYSNISKYDASLIRNDCLSRFGKDSFVKRLKTIYASIQDKGKNHIK